MYAFLQLQPVSTGITQTQRFVVPKGEPVQKIATRLAEDGLIRNPWAFRLTVKLDKVESKLQAGSFELSPSMSLREIGQKLSTGTNDVWVTIPEGWRREEIAQSLSKLELGSYNAAEFLRVTEGLEGKLFPDTYLVPREMTSQALANVLTNTFEKKIEIGLADEIEASDHDFESALVMASLIEREARGYEEMRHVAGILWHRIAIGMPLQVDATLQYSKGYSATQQSWWVSPTAADKAVDSPFNTYSNPGLPPRPICNPGLDAVRAALNPLETDDLFYLHDGQGVIHYGRTLDEHNANVVRYLK